MRKAIMMKMMPVAVSLCLLIACFSYIYNAPVSNSWFHSEYSTSGSYTVGKIDFWFFNEQNHSIDLYLYAHAPTRYFAVGENRPYLQPDSNIKDANFNRTVNRQAILGSNRGDVDMNVRLSYIDANSAANETFYYIFVPEDPTDINYTTNFLAAPPNYSAYIDNLILATGMPTGTVAERKAALAKINSDAMTKINSVLKPKITHDTNNARLCYMLFWQEYDTANWYNLPGDYIFKTLTYPISLTANIYQDGMLIP